MAPVVSARPILPVVLSICGAGAVFHVFLKHLECPSCEGRIQSFACFSSELPAVLF